MTVRSTARSTARSLPLLAASALLWACGSSSGAAPAPDGPPDAGARSPQAASPVCDRYAAPGGSDRAAGTAGEPLRTAQRLSRTLKPGETGCLRAGTYSAEVESPYVLRFDRGGRPGAPVTVRSAPGERATLRGMIYAPRWVSDVRLTHVDVDGRRRRGRGTSGVGIQVMGTRVTIADADVTNRRTRSCVILGDLGGYGRARRTAIRRTVFHDCGDPGNGVYDHAIYVQASDGAQITGNVFVRSAGWAVHLYPDARRTLVRGNVMWDNGGGVVFGGNGRRASAGNVVVDNVIGASRRRPELTSSWGGPVGTGNVARSNCLVPRGRPAEGRGYVARDNRVVRSPDAGGCAATASAARQTALGAGVTGALRRLLADG